jgi:hypothetical protein
MWDIAMAVLLGKTNRDLLSNLMMHFKLLEKQEQTKPKSSRQREVIKIRAKINKIETKKKIQ